MKQEDKELLLKDLCARLSYGVKVAFFYHAEPKTLIQIECINNLGYSHLEDEDGNTTIVEFVKPYLFPLSSITGEQEKEYASLVWFNGLSRGWNSDDAVILDEIPMLMDFYHKNHFDYRGLIEKGLAIDATGLNIY